MTAEPAEDAGVQITRAGMLSTVQDRGRHNVGAMGLSPSGCADWFSAGAANRLTGNEPGAALIETTLTGFSFTARADVRMAVTGAEATLRVDDELAVLWQSRRLCRGQRVDVGTAQLGLRSYIAFGGGVQVAAMLGSAATDLGAGFGGFEGRALRDGDMLQIASVAAVERERRVTSADGRLPERSRPSWSREPVLRVTLGPHASVVPAEELAALVHRRYQVSHECSRQGIRLKGAAVRAQSAGDMLSFGVCAGCVQLTRDGLPIILLAEHQTTGGYPVALNVISADLPVAAQLRPGDTVGFQRVTLAQAALALEARLHDLQSWEPAHQ